MTISDADTYDDGSEGYVIAPVQTPDLAAALINTATHKGYRMHISKATTIDENRHDAARTSTVKLHGHMAPVWGKTLPAVIFDATFTITYSPNHIGAQARNPIVELTALDVTDATDDNATATAVAIIDEDTNTPLVRGSLDNSDLDNMPDQCITFIIEQMKHIRRMKDAVSHDLIKDAIEKALTNAAQTTGIAIDIHNIDFGTDHGAEWDNRSPMTVVRGEISLRKLTHITSKFYITFDADTPTPRSNTHHHRARHGHRAAAARRRHGVRRIRGMRHPHHRLTRRRIYACGTHIHQPNPAIHGQRDWYPARNDALTRSHTHPPQQHTKETPTMTTTNDRIVDDTKTMPDLGHILKSVAYQQGHFVYIDQTRVLDSDQHTANRVTTTDLTGAIVVGNNGSEPVPFIASFKRTYFVSTDERQTPTTTLMHLAVGEGHDAKALLELDNMPVRGHDTSVIETVVQLIADTARECNTTNARHVEIRQQLTEALATAQRKYTHDVVLSDIEFLRDADNDGKCCVKVCMYGKISIDHSSAYVPFRITCDVDVSEDDNIFHIQTFGVHLTDDDAMPIYTNFDKGLPHMHIVDSPQEAMSSIIFLLAMKAEEYLRTV